MEFRGFKKIRQKNKLPAVGIELATLTIIGLKVWLLSNPANLSCLACLRLSKPCEVMLYSSFSSSTLFWQYCVKRVGSYFYLIVFHSTFLFNFLFWFAESNKHQTSKPVMVSVMSSLPTADKFSFC